MVYRLKETIQLAVSIDDAWEFFSNPNNLKVITPPELNMQIQSELPDEIYAGMIITYKVHPVLSIPLTWVTEITQVKRPHLFVDEQRYGPYRMWHHQHHINESKRGVEVTDLVDFILPFGPLGNLAYQLFVKKQLSEIFEFRKKVLLERLS